MNRNHSRRTPFVMQGRYSQEFLDELAQALGIKWTYVASQSIPIEKIEVRPLPPPIGKLYYIEPKYKSND